MPLGMLAVLGVQFLTGMAVNLFVKLPSTQANMDTMMGNGPLLAIHMMFGMVLAGGAVLTVAFAVPLGRRPIVAAAVALGGIIVAGLGGLTFLMGGHSDGASYTMALGFMTSVAGYIFELVAIK